MLPANTIPSGAFSGNGATMPYTPERLSAEPESPAEASLEGLAAEYDYWLKQVHAGFKHEETWRSEARQAEILAWGDPDKAFHEDASAKARTNIIYSNIETLKPLIYSQPPEPIVRRRFMGDGQSDPVGRLAAEVAQRVAQCLIDTTRLDPTLESARDDWLIPGRAASRVFYRAQVETGTDPMTGAEWQEKVHEEVICKPWPWARMILSPSSSWEDIQWIAWETPMTRAEVAELMGEQIADMLSYPISGLTHRSDATGMTEGQMWAPKDRAQSDERTVSAHDQTIVFEIWCKKDRTIRWLSPTFKDGLLDVQPDPLGLEDFFDCPEPLFASRRGSSLDVRPDVAYYAHRCEEIDQAQAKLRKIIKAISVAGVYPGDKKDVLDKLLSGDGKLVNVEDWQTFAMEGGIQSLIQWLPIEHFVAAAVALQGLIEQAKMTVFEISGISDLVRGQGDPDETATAQKIKGRYAGLRLQSRQRGMGEYARNLLRLMLEVVFEHFDTETIADMCNYDMPFTEAEREQNLALIEARKQQEAMAAQHEAMAAEGMPVAPLQLQPLPEPRWTEDEPSWEAVHALLKQDFRRKFTIQVETDSTIISDEEQDKEARIQFLAALSGFLETLMPLAQAGMVDGRVAKELLLFGVRGFRNARSLEGLISSLPDDVSAEPPEDTSVTVAKIKAEVDRVISTEDNATKLEIERMKQDTARRQGAASALLKAGEMDSRERAGAEDRASRERQATAKQGAA